MISILIIFLAIGLVVTFLICSSNKSSSFSHFSGLDNLSCKGENCKDISLSVDDLTAPYVPSIDADVEIHLTFVERQAEIMPGVTYNYWTLNGTVPGPFMRVHQGDVVKIVMTNPSTNSYPHSLDLHAAIAPGGGSGPLSSVGNVNPGETKSFVFVAQTPGLYVYHCSTNPVPVHIVNGLYGLILVESNLPPVDKEFVVVQGEIYTSGSLDEKGFQTFDNEKMLSESPVYVVFNGRKTALHDNPLRAKVGERIRIYFGNLGVSKISSFHIIGGIFDTVYTDGGLTSHPMRDISTINVPCGGAVIVDLTIDTPGTYVLVDHALSRLDRGASGILEITKE